MNKVNRKSEPGRQATELSEKSVCEGAGGGFNDATEREINKKNQTASPLLRRATFIVFQQFVMKYAPPTKSKEFIADLTALVEVR